MARLTPRKKAKLFQEFNNREMPWLKTQFVFKDEEYLLLGEGHFSDVYAMESTEFPDAKYAVKVLGMKADSRIYKSDISSYETEPALQKQLSEICDNVVKILDSQIVSVRMNAKGNVEDIQMGDYGIDKPEWFVLVMILMEYLEPVIDIDLDQGMQKQIVQPLLAKADEGEVLALARDIANALAVSHEKNIMHRDVKLENIFYDSYSGKYKLGDFGIARVTNQGNASTVGKGTLAYAAPEVESTDGKKYSYGADIYSFGMTLYLLLNDLRFPGSSDYHFNPNVKFDSKAEIELPSHGSEELREYVCRMIQYDVKKRPKSMEEVLSVLDYLIDKYQKQSEIKQKEQNILENEAGVTNQDILNTAKNEPAQDLLISEAVGRKQETQVKEEVEREQEAIIKEQKNFDLDDLNRKLKENPPIRYSNPSINNSTATRQQIKVEANQKAKPETTKKTTKETEKETKEEKVKKTSSNKGKFSLWGAIFLVVSMTYFGGVLGGISVPTQSAWFLVVMGADALLATISFAVKVKTGNKAPYILYFLAFGATTYMLITGGNNWLLLFLVISLFFGGVIENFILSLACFLFCFMSDYPIVSQLMTEYCQPKLALFFFVLFVLGSHYSMYGDGNVAKRGYKSTLDIIFRDTMSPFFSGIAIFACGIVLWVWNKFSILDVAPLLMNMHFIWAGLILAFIGLVGVIFTED